MEDRNYRNPAEAAMHLSMLLDEKFAHDNVTRWVLYAASRAAHEPEVDHAEVVGLITAIEERCESNHLERAMRNAVEQLWSMLNRDQETAADGQPASARRVARIVGISTAATAYDRRQ